MMMTLCNLCHTVLPAEANFCFKCGTAVSHPKICCGIALPLKFKRCPVCEKPSHVASQRLPRQQPPPPASAQESEADAFKPSSRRTVISPAPLANPEPGTAPYVGMTFFATSSRNKGEKHAMQLAKEHVLVHEKKTYNATLMVLSKSRHTDFAEAATNGKHCWLVCECDSKTKSLPGTYAPGKCTRRIEFRANKVFTKCRVAQIIGEHVDCSSTKQLRRPSLAAAVESEALAPSPSSANTLATLRDATSPAQSARSSPSAPRMRSDQRKALADRQATMTTFKQADEARRTSYTQKPKAERAKKQKTTEAAAE